MTHYLVVEPPTNSPLLRVLSFLYPVLLAWWFCRCSLRLFRGREKFDDTQNPKTALCKTGLPPLYQQLPGTSSFGFWSFLICIILLNMEGIWPSPCVYGRDRIPTCLFPLPKPGQDWSGPSTIDSGVSFPSLLHCFNSRIYGCAMMLVRWN
jgi:hypothetical protein